MPASVLKRILLVCVVCALFLPANAFAKQFQTTLTFGMTANEIVAALLLKLPEGYHCYAPDTLTTGRPTELEMRVDEKTLPSLYPKGAAQRDIYAPSESVFVYEGDTYVFATLPKDALGKAYTAQISLLLCSKRNCIPTNQDLKGFVPTTIPPIADQPWFDAFKQTMADNTAEPILPPSAPHDTTPLPPPAFFDTHLTPEYATSVFEITSLSKALFFGILAGLILNFMPCVLPVLTFKMSGLLFIGTKSWAERIHTFRVHNLFFAAGILTFFTLLAFFLGLADAIWGQLFQSETLILGMLLLVFLFGLSLLDVFTLPVIDLRIAEKTSNPHLGAYLTGFMTTLLATPCSGPLLGGVLGWTCTQPFVMVILIFWAIGIGMALPYLLFALYPKAVHLLPKTGPWMHGLERIAGFFLLGTSLYLLSILPKEKYIPILTILLLVAGMAWVYGQYLTNTNSKLKKYLALCCLLGFLALSIHIVQRPVQKTIAWQEFSEQYFADNLGQKMLLIEFTADWCPNCKLMEKTVLTDSIMHELQEKEQFAMIKADLTQANAAATYLLTELGSRSIPLTAIFPTGQNANSPIVIRDVYTKDMLRKSFAKACDKNSYPTPQAARKQTKNANESPS